MNGLFIPLGSRFEEDVTEFLSQASNIIKSEVRILNISKIAASLECTGGDLPHEVKRKVYDLVSFLGNNNGGRPPELFILADASDSRSQILEQIVLYLRLLLLIKFGINSRLQCFGFLQNGIEEDVYQKRFEFLTRIQRLKADDYQNKDSLPPFSMTESSDFNWAGPLIDRFFALRLPPENSKPDYGVLLRYCRLCLEGAIGFEDYTHFSSYTINGLLINSNADYIRAIAEKAFFYRSREIIRNGLNPNKAFKKNIAVFANNLIEGMISIIPGPERLVSCMPRCGEVPEGLTFEQLEQTVFGEDMAEAFESICSLESVQNELNKKEPENIAGLKAFLINKYMEEKGLGVDTLQTLISSDGDVYLDIESLFAPNREEWKHCRKSIETVRKSPCKKFMRKSLSAREATMSLINTVYTKKYILQKLEVERLILEELKGLLPKVLKSLRGDLNNMTNLAEQRYVNALKMLHADKKEKESIDKAYSKLAETLFETNPGLIFSIFKGYCKIMKDDQPDRFERLDKFIAEKFNSYSDEKLRGIESLSREIRIRSSLLPKTDQSPKEMLASGIQSKAEQLKPPVSFDMDIENKAWHEYQRVYILPGPRTEQLFENSASHAAMPGPDASSDLYALKVWADSRILPLI